MGGQNTTQLTTPKVLKRVQIGHHFVMSMTLRQVLRFEKGGNDACVGFVTKDPFVKSRSGAVF
jgi:hypothetical protein